MTCHPALRLQGQRLTCQLADGYTFVSEGDSKPTMYIMRKDGKRQI